MRSSHVFPLFAPRSIPLETAPPKNCVSPDLKKKYVELDSVVWYGLYNTNEGDESWLD